MTVYHQSSQKDILSRLYTSHHLYIPAVVISSQLYTSCRYFIPNIYWYTIAIDISSQQYTSHRCFIQNIRLIYISKIFHHDYILICTKNIWIWYGRFIVHMKCEKFYLIFYTLTTNGEKNTENPNDLDKMFMIKET